jgi:hypothetical protein
MSNTASGSAYSGWDIPFATPPMVWRDEWREKFFLALGSDKLAGRHYETLVQLGCDEQRLLALLNFYTDERFHGNFVGLREPALEAAKLAAQFHRDVRRLRESVARLRQNSYGCKWINVINGESGAVSETEAQLDFLCKLMDKFIPFMKKEGSRRGILRKERVLVWLVRYVRKSTGKPHFPALAHLVQVAQITMGLEGKVDEETLRQACKRYEKKYPDLPRPVRYQ